MEDFKFDVGEIKKEHEHSTIDCTFTWEVPDFLDRTEKAIRSPSFSFLKADGQWADFNMVVFPKGKTKESKYITMWFRLNGNCEPDWFTFTIKIKNDEEFNPKNWFPSPTFFDTTKNENCFEDLEFKKNSTLIQNRETLLPNGAITFLVNIKNEIRERKPDPSEDLAQDLDYVFPELEFTDFTIICGEKRFPCHAFMLTARSEVFYGMLKSDFKEKINMELRIDTIQPDIVYEMLRFIYTAQVEDMSLEKTMDLLKAADQYQLLGLKDICGTRLMKKLTNDTVFSLLILGDTYQEENLKGKAIMHAVKNAKTLIKTPGWELTTREHPRLMIDVTSHLIQDRDSE